MTAYRRGDRLHVPEQELTVQSAPNSLGVYVADGTPGRGTFVNADALLRLSATRITPSLVDGAVYQDLVGVCWLVTGGLPWRMHADWLRVGDTAPHAADLTRLVPEKETR